MKNATWAKLATALMREGSIALLLSHWRGEAIWQITAGGARAHLTFTAPVSCTASARNKLGEIFEAFCISSEPDKCVSTPLLALHAKEKAYLKR